ncbi:unnamed protein product [Heterobilharzia americana]|nr:unnamed protein product [Heterobilharzia americana]
MCGVGFCGHIHRNICLCLAIYTLVGSRIPCLHCQVANFAPSEHLNTMFSSLTNGTQHLDKQKLTNLLKHLQIFLNEVPLDEHGSRENKCFTASEMLAFFSANHSYLNKTEFQALLPTIVYELHTGVCSHIHNDELDHSTHSFDWKAFLAASGAVLLVSASGLIVVCLVPMMSRSFYNVVTQFLIALAVGSLAGDAFLHLIPHAFSTHSRHHSHPHHEEHNGHNNHHHHHNSELSTELSSHRKMILEALVALLGIYIFFLTERLTIICQNKMSRRKLKRQRVSGALNVLDFNDEKIHDHKVRNQFHGIDTTHATVDDFGNCNGYKQIENNSNGDNPVINRNNKEVKNSNAFHISTSDGIGYDGCSGGGVQSTVSNEGQLCNRPPDRPMDNNRCVDYLNDKQLYPSDGQLNRVDKQQEFVGSNIVDGGPFTNFSDLKKSSTSCMDIPDLKNSDKQLTTIELTNHMVVTQASTDISSAIVKKNSSFSYLGSAEQSQTHPHRDKPHGHHHGHSHDLSSVRAIAYTIIAGDGLHNFCDGIAIGAAFANDIRGGLSTSIAVLCHELPHELGDFAVLLHAGMSVKSALFYNLLSSILCAAGMILGFLLGGMHSLDTWIFMLAAGMFVYIALVDMMPELSTNQLKGNRRCHQPSILFLWQNLGILLGFCIMLLIAFYENEFISH